LQEAFDAALERVREFFKEILGERVFYDPRYAVPGFHVFITKGGDPRRDNVAQRAHFDMQWMHAMPGYVPRGTVASTLPIEEPSGGACLAVWPARYQGAVRLGFAARDYAAKHPWRRATC